MPLRGLRVGLNMEEEGAALFFLAALRTRTFPAGTPKGLKSGEKRGGEDDLSGAEDLADGRGCVVAVSFVYPSARDSWVDWLLSLFSTLEISCEHVGDSSWSVGAGARPWSLGSSSSSPMSAIKLLSISWAMGRGRVWWDGARCGGRGGDGRGDKSR